MIPFEYSIVKIIGRIRGDKHKETLNKWFMKKGIIFPGGYWSTYKF